MAEQARPQLRGSQAPTRLGRLRAVQDDLRAALTWALERREREIAVRLAGALGMFWHQSGAPSEGRRWLVAALEGSADLPAALRGRALHEAGSLATDLSDLPAAEQALREALRLLRTTGDAAAIAHTLNNLGIVARARGDLDRALELFSEGLALRRMLGDDPGAGSSLSNLAMIAHDRGDYAAAQRFLRDAVAVAQRTGDRRRLSMLFTNLATVTSGAGDYARARGYAEEALAICRAWSFHLHSPWAPGALGQTARRMGDNQAAAVYLGEALALFQKMADPKRVSECLEELAALAGAVGEPLLAAQLHGAADDLRAALGLADSAHSYAEYRRDLDTIRAQVDAAAWQSAWQAGRAAPLDDLLARLGQAIPASGPRARPDPDRIVASPAQEFRRCWPKTCAPRSNLHSARRGA